MVLLCLDGKQVGVHATAGHELIMCPVLNNRAMLQHINTVGHPDRRQAMADEDSHAPGRELAEFLENLVLGFGIHGARRLIENDELGVAQERPGQRYLLPLTKAELFAIFEPLP